MLALQAEIFADHTAKITAWLPVSTPPRTIVDLGCGTGAGTFALLAQFPDARVIAVDSAEDHLSHLQRTADARGVATRVRLVQADLDAVWPDIGPADLVWAANALHHLADPDRALAEAYRMLTPRRAARGRRTDSLRPLPAAGRPGVPSGPRAAMPRRAPAPAGGAASPHRCRLGGQAHRGGIPHRGHHIADDRGQRSRPPRGGRVRAREPAAPAASSDRPRAGRRSCCTRRPGRSGRPALRVPPTGPGRPGRADGVGGSPPLRPA
ncbi:class I SAM-dependent methyltransferase [Thermocrispum agreste]|uniref:class I SAM-dependent methyltransferase n=1 Tax=Thermocrispum agreste TaxID=37925 RepID=UPI003CCBA78F